MPKVWYTSDLHLGHPHVAASRGLSNPLDLKDTTLHDQTIIDNWTENVGKNDIVWVLGDVALNKLPMALGIIKHLPGEKHLIAGNHDTCHPINVRSHRKQRAYLEAFESVQTAAHRKIAGRQVLLSHFPYTKDRDIPSRHLQWRLRDEGRWLLHGHTHDTKDPVDGREIHVGLDAWHLSPVPESKIEEIILQRKM